MFGRKRERWLMRSVAAMLLAGGVGLLADRDGPSRGMRASSAIGALGLGAIGGGEALRGKISFLYALDAVVEWAFALAWLATLRPRAAPPDARIARARA